MDIKLLRAVIEEFGTYEEYVSFLHKSSDCDKCEYFRDCENQCGRNIWKRREGKKRGQKMNSYKEREWAAINIVQIREDIRRKEADIKALKKKLDWYEAVYFDAQVACAEETRRQAEEECRRNIWE